MLMFIIYTNILFSVNYLLNSGFALNNINANNNNDNNNYLMGFPAWKLKPTLLLPTYVDQEVFWRGVSLHCMWVLSMSLYKVYD